LTLHALAGIVARVGRVAVESARTAHGDSPGPGSSQDTRLIS
jgi:hypothetical protein